MRIASIFSIASRFSARDRRPVVRRVPVRVRVEVRRDVDDRLEDRRGVRTVGTRLEHQVLDEVGEARLALRIFARADVVADVDLDELRRRVGHDHEPQPVRFEHAALLGARERELRRCRRCTTARARRATAAAPAHRIFDMRGIFAKFPSNCKRRVTWLVATPAIGVRRRATSHRDSRLRVGPVLRLVCAADVERPVTERSSATRRPLDAVLHGDVGAAVVLRRAHVPARST